MRPDVETAQITTQGQNTYLRVLEHLLRVCHNDWDDAEGVQRPASQASCIISCEN